MYALSRVITGFRSDLGDYFNKVELSDLRKQIAERQDIGIMKGAMEFRRQITKGFLR